MHHKFTNWHCLLLLLGLATFSAIMVWQGGTWLGNRNTGEDQSRLETTSEDPYKKEPTEVNIKRVAIEEVVASSQGEFGVWVEYLGIEEQPKIVVNEDQTFYAASVTKVPLLITLYRLFDEGKMSPDQEVVYLEEDKEWGDGSIQYEKVGSQYSLQEIATRMAKESDNVAKNILYRVIPWEEIAKTYALVGISSNTLENIYSAEEMAQVWEYLYKTSLEKESAREILHLLTNTNFEDRIAAAVSEDTIVSHKIGTWPETGSWHDCGIVFTENPVLICVMSEESTYEEAVQIIKKITRIALE